LEKFAAFEGFERFETFRDLEDFGGCEETVVDVGESDNLDVVDAVGVVEFGKMACAWPCVRV
jgi:hypothetical protein